MTDSHYVIRGGEAGRERLRMLARIMAPTTRALLARAGVGAGMTCLDVGCGGGDVSVELARLVGPRGRVIGIDMDATKIDLARREAAALGLANVEFRVATIAQPGVTGGIDVAYARFVLTHLPDPQAVLAQLRGVLRPGGRMVVEDIDFTGHFAHPDAPAFRRYVYLYTQVVQRRGADPNIGLRLPGLLLAAGYGGVGVQVVQPAGLTGEVKELSPLTLESIVDALVDEGLATADEVAATVRDLYAFARDPGTLMSLPRIVQAWGVV
ncbi:MAG: methyltransferase domain-containing protein [Deltaproteobacteria bacterium]|nr:methyltransferase domain-containing protein [Deltaproteobacteria bacterium]